MAANIDSLNSKWSSLDAARGTWDTYVQELMDLYMPRKAQVSRLEMEGTPDTNEEEILFDSTGIQANVTLANGTLASMTPREAPWFSFEVPETHKDDREAKDWMQEATMVARREIAESNFYSEVHELNLDLGACGTGLLTCLEGERNFLNFKSFPFGTYAISEGKDGFVDTVFIKWRMSPRRAVAEFGERNVPPKWADEVVKGSEESEQKTDIIWAVYPRHHSERIGAEKGSQESMPISSVWFVPGDEKMILKESGFLEMPAFVSRYMTANEDVYGYGPGAMAIAECRSLQFLQRMLDELAEQKARPRLLSKEELEVDLAPYGVTVGDPDSIREWGSSGDYNVGKDRVLERQRALNDHFQVDLWKMFAQRDKEMTAAEVAELSSEKLSQFSPTYSRRVTELYNPLLQRIFLMLLRANKFEEIPESMKEILPDGNEGMISPKIHYNSRIALAINQVENAGLIRHMQTVLAISEARPDILDNYDMDETARLMGRNDGVPPEIFLKEKQVDEIRQQQQQQQAAMMAAESAAKMTPGS